MRRYLKDGKIYDTCLGQEYTSAFDDFCYSLTCKKCQLSGLRSQCEAWMEKENILFTLIDGTYIQLVDET